MARSSRSQQRRSRIRKPRHDRLTALQLLPAAVLLQLQAPLLRSHLRAGSPRILPHTGGRPLAAVPPAVSCLRWLYCITDVSAPLRLSLFIAIRFKLCTE